MYEIEKENWKNNIQVKGLEKKQCRNYRIYLEPKKVYDEYFHYGIWGKDEVLEGIIYFSNSEIYQQKEDNELDRIDRVIGQAKKIYKQFYRFIELNDREKISSCYNPQTEKEIDKTIENKIREKIEQLSKENDNYMFISNKDRQTGKTEEEIRRIKDEKKIEEIATRRIKELIRYGENVDDNRKREIREETRKEYFSRKKLIESKKGLSYSTRERFRYAHFPEYSLEDNPQPYIIRHWTEDIYDILNYLQKLEKEDKVEYYKIWLDTRIQRLRNRVEFQTEEKKEEIKREIQTLEEAKQKIENIQEKRKTNQER